MFVPRPLLRRRRPETESLNEPDDEDLERLAGLREQGSRMHLPHPVRGFLAFEAEAEARRAAELLRKEGYRCQIRAFQDGSWVITAVIQVVPTAGAITKLREHFVAVTSAHGGTYRGWDAPVVY